MLVAFRFNDPRPLSRLVAWWQRSDASHCEVVLAVQGDVHLCASSSWLDGGVRAKSIWLEPAKWRLYDLPRDEAFARAWFDQHRGERYDLLGLLGFTFRRVKGWLRAWWCSEACAAMAGVAEPWRYDVATFESLCAALGRRVQ